MGQNDILEVLRQHNGKWFNSRQLQNMLRVNQSSISISLKKLREFKLVSYQEIKSSSRAREYIYRLQ